ncbi:MULTISPECIES: phage baseplate protein [Methanobacterium]|uniref:Baseplate structural protein Gp10 C-terminal domain-containing protein n=1 Tax=Methanobacterium bryantii TaxID=2161 RepID=A0A2A2H928_METBR|nr:MULTISPECIES: hypothetical protein [Methanobacterium]OEC87903.1 hypothetical protein A9507_06925 [Methanobacterium sp. A39]PAV05770.1 hypothetical protein ASJ80_08535 [Methanobacterium bryantii]
MVEDVNEYFTADDPNYAERLNNPNILTDIITIKPKITLPEAFKTGEYPTTENKTKALFSIVQVMNNTCTNTGDGFTASANDQSFTLRVYPNFSSFKWWNSITFAKTGTVTCSMKDSETGTELIASITSGANLNTYNIEHKPVDIIFTLQNGARVTDITFEYQNQAKISGSEFSIPKDNITGLVSELAAKANQSDITAINNALAGKASLSDITSINNALATKLNSSVYTASDIKSKLLTVDGAGSGVDTDFFRGIDLNKFMYVNPTVIPSSADLNTYMSTGIYLQPSNANAANGSNYPVPYAGVLEVFTYSTSMVWQRYTLFEAYKTTVYVRGYYNGGSGGTWNSWNKQWDSENDGSGSGMDSDTVDNKHASDFVLATEYTAANIASKVFDLLYPVGSIVEFATNINPNSLSGWKGTWTQIKDKFTLAAGDIYTAGQTGGSATHTLTEAQMPVHKHDVSIPSSGQTTTPAGGNSATGSSGAHTHSINYKLQSPTNGSAVRCTDVGDASNSDVINSGGAHTHSTPAHTHTVPNHSHSVNESNKGSGVAHNNMPPYLVVSKWKRTA